MEPKYKRQACHDQQGPQGRHGRVGTDEQHPKPDAGEPNGQINQVTAGKHERATVKDSLELSEGGDRSGKGDGAD